MSKTGRLKYIHIIDNDGGAAFPFTQDNIESGMSLRDYYAGEVIKSLLVINKTKCPGDTDRGLINRAFDMAQVMVEVGIKRDEDDE